MKKTENVNIGGAAFILDEDAYEEIEKYLTRSKKSLHDNPDKDEIIEDIESSLAEHLLATNQKVISKLIAQEIVDKMGEVEGSESKEEEDENNSENEKEKFFKKTIYKDQNNKIIDGVCAGIANSLDVDPLWIRISFVILLFATGGLMILFYLILSVIMKSDKTHKAKNVAELIEDSKKKLKNSDSKLGYQKALAGVAIVFYRLFQVISKIVTVALIFAFTTTLISIIAALSFSRSEIDGFDELSSFSIVALSGSLMFLFAIPVIALFASLFGKKIKGGYAAVLWTLWSVALSGLIVNLALNTPTINDIIKANVNSNNFKITDSEEGFNWCISTKGSCENDIIEN